MMEAMWLAKTFSRSRRDCSILELMELIDWAVLWQHNFLCPTFSMTAPTRNNLIAQLITATITSLKFVLEHRLRRLWLTNFTLWSIWSQAMVLTRREYQWKSIVREESFMVWSIFQWTSWTILIRFWRSSIWELLEVPRNGVNWRSSDHWWPNSCQWCITWTTGDVNLLTELWKAEHLKLLW